MWVIIVNDNLCEHRDSRISDLLGNTESEKFICKYTGGTKYNTTTCVNIAIIYKNQSTADKFISRYNSDNGKKQYSNSFSYIPDKFLHCRKLTIKEWNSIIDYKIEKLKSKYIRVKEKLETKRNQYR